MANDCPKKEVKTNNIELNEEEEEEETNRNEGESEEESDSTEEIYTGSNRVSSNKTTIKNKTKEETAPYISLESVIHINGKPARTLFDTGTIGADLISNRFIITHNIPYTPLKMQTSFKMSVKGSRSSTNHSMEAEIQMGKARFPKQSMLVLI